MPEATAGFPPEVWASTRPTERTERIRQRLFAFERRVDLERACITTDSYRRTEGLPMPVRRATMLLDLARGSSIAIGEDELIVGNRSLLPRMGVIAPEGAVSWIDAELERLSTRPQDRFSIGPDEIQELREEVFPHWRGHTLEDAVAARVPEHIWNAAQGGAKAFSLNQTDHAQGHILPDVEGWLRLGVGGLHEQVLQAKKRQDGHAAKRAFYDAALIALQAASEFIGRYADLAEAQATRMARLLLDETPGGTNERRHAELLDIACRCRWLAQHPARSFPEALQAVWFLFVLLQMESNASSFSPGRLDQYLLPYLQQDLAAGALDLPSAQEWIELLWLKFNEIVLLRSSASARYFAGFPIGFNVILGGLDTHGCDATNLLSFMALRAQADLGLTQPNLSIRIHRRSLPEFLRAAAFVISRGSGMPQVFNDEVIIAGQVARGVHLTDARDYAVVGCVELSVPGKALGWSDAAMFNMARVLELTLYGGRDPKTGELVGLRTSCLDQMASFEELERAYDAQLAHFVRLMVDGCDMVDRVHAELLPSPFLSLVIADCVERGVDVTAGGARYNFSGVQGVQIANVADSLAALRQAVFDEKWLSAAQMLECLRRDFADAEPLRQRLLNRVPKYGNDLDRVDQMAQKWATRYAELVSAYPTVRGGVFQPGFYTVSAHIPMGANVGATPDGRRAGQPLADGGLSPMGGRDRRGPTAVLRSVGKLDLEKASNGTLLNMKFLPSFFEGVGREGAPTANALDKFVFLLRGFCALRIPHVQFNVVSGETLRHAQAYPEAHRGLVVRVAGYSAYFTELDRALQDEIIARTEYADAV